MHVAITRHQYIGLLYIPQAPALAKPGSRIREQRGVHWNSGTINIIEYTGGHNLARIARLTFASLK